MKPWHIRPKGKAFIVLRNGINVSFFPSSYPSVASAMSAIKQMAGHLARWN